jgi:hypothetical protein
MGTVYAGFMMCFFAFALFERVLFGAPHYVAHLFKMFHEKNGYLR